VLPDFQFTKYNTDHFFRTDPPPTNFTSVDYKIINICIRQDASTVVCVNTHWMLTDKK